MQPRTSLSKRFHNRQSGWGHLRHECGSSGPTVHRAHAGVFSDFQKETSSLKPVLCWLLISALELSIQLPSNAFSEEVVDSTVGSVGGETQRSFLAMLFGATSHRF